MMNRTIEARTRYFWRVCSSTLSSFIRDDCFSKAAALSFYTLLALVPLLAVTFGIAKGFGVEKYLEEEVKKQLFTQPELADQIISYAYLALEHAHIGVIAGMGVIILFWTSLQLLDNIEKFFNEIWRIKNFRWFFRRFSDYLVLVILGTIFLILSNSLSVYVITLSHTSPLLQPFNHYIILLFRAIPFIINWILFSFLYIYMPNAKVDWRCALAGGFLASMAYQIVQSFYLYFQIGVTGYNAIYGSFAAFPLFLIWLNVSWLVVLAGAEITYQAGVLPFALEESRYKTVTKKQFAVVIAMRYAESFFKGDSPLTIRQIAQELGTSSQIVGSIATHLCDQGVLARINASTYLLSRSPESITIQNIYDAMDNALYEKLPLLAGSQFAYYEQCCRELDQSSCDSEKNLSLKGLFNIKTTIEHYGLS